MARREEARLTFSNSHYGHTCTGVCPYVSVDALPGWRTTLKSVWRGPEDWAERIITNVGEALVASVILTPVRFLARVSPDVDRQRAPLDEALVTSRLCASVRPLVGVYPKMPLQVRLAVEALRWGRVSEHTRAILMPPTSRGDRVLQRPRHQRTLPHDFQVHWKGRAVGSFSTSSISSISRDAQGPSSSVTTPAGSKIGAQDELGGGSAAHVPYL